MISLMGEDDPGIWGPSQVVGPMGDVGSVSDSSPLQVFVRAKEKINDIFMEIEDYVHHTVTYIQSKFINFHSFIRHSVNPYKVNQPLGYRTCHNTTVL